MTSFSELSIARQQALATFRADFPTDEDRAELHVETVARWTKRRLDWLPETIVERVLDDLVALLPNPYPRTDGTRPPEIADLEPINFEGFFDEIEDQRFLVDPLLPEGRLVSLYAAGKTGKSLLTLEIAAKLALGEPFLEEPVRDPKHVLYLDFEMTRFDLQSRMVDFGLDRNERTLNEYFHYYLLPSLHPLDTAEGGAQILALVDHHEPELVIIDTLARVTDGGENDADTYKSMYRHTFQPLKDRGVTVLRIDHAGKNDAKGQRGSSAKNDDVDVVWLLQRDSDTQSLYLRLERTRIDGMPRYREITKTPIDLEDGSRIWTHSLDQQTYPNDHQLRIIDELDTRGAEVDISRRDARTRYPDIEFRNAEWSIISKWRKRYPNRGTTAFDLKHSGTDMGTTPETVPDHPETLT